LGGNPQPFFTSPDQALASIILVASWIGVGYWMIFLIAGLEADAGSILRSGAHRQGWTVAHVLLDHPSIAQTAAAVRAGRQHCGELRTLCSRSAA
jgi:hypothetical protein